MGIEPVRLLIADDHPIYRDGLAHLLSAFDTVDVVATAGDGDEAVRLAAELDPDVVIMDLRMPGMDGVQATRAIATGSPRTAVVVLTMFDDDDLVHAAIRAGAKGYLLKEADDDEVVRAVLAVAAGDAIFGSAIAARVLANVADHAPRPAESPFPQLTAREREVLDLVAAGFANQELAAMLHISHRTARNHVSNIFAKLHVSDRAQAIVTAREAGLGVRQRNT